MRVSVWFGLFPGRDRVLHQGFACYNTPWDGMFDHNLTQLWSMWEALCLHAKPIAPF